MKDLKLTVGGEIILPHCRVATNLFSKTRGLLGRDERFAREGLFFPNSRSIQMIGMKYDITAVSVNKVGRIRDVRYMKKGWHSFTDVGAKHILECSADDYEEWKCRIGQMIILED